MSVSREVRVAVIDSGFDRLTVESRVEAGVCFSEHGENGAVAMTDDYRDRIGHGTAIANLILQYAPSATVIPIRVFHRHLETSPATLAAAIRWAASQRADVINLSLGTLRDDVIHLLYRACDRAQSAGSIVVAAAGEGVKPLAPAYFAPVIGVRGCALTEATSFLYHEGKDIECEARNWHVVSGLGGRKTLYKGSSFAVPIIASHVAEFRGASRGATLRGVREMLQETATKSERTPARAAP